MSASRARWRARNLIAIALLGLAALATLATARADAAAYGGISGVAPPPPPTAEAPAPETGSGPVGRASLVGGKAIAPAAVKKAIQAANRIRTKPYVWGGGHGRWWDRGYDCSGSVSFALRGAGLLTAPMVSGSLARWGEAGPGRWITIYANAGHVYAEIAGLRWDTSGTAGSGPRWHEDDRGGAGFVVRHPPGY